ncbi:MAG TPA: hypothetical protein VJ867_06320 [Gemmatimonadaceae bacterium]|nr:hypothetical protein [Gemmatimonadaceae bacterium]
MPIRIQTVLALTSLAALVPTIAPAQACITGRLAQRGTIQNWTSHISDSGNQTTTIRTQRGNCELRLDARGDFSMRPDLKAFDRVGDYVEVEERDGDKSRRVRVTSRGGVLEYRWTVDGVNGFDVDRDQWLADMLLAVERLTGTMAKPRVAAMLQQGGVNAVLDETARLATDYAKRMYFIELFADAKLNDDQVERVLGQAADSMSSDYERAELIRMLATRGKMNDRLARGVIRVADRMSSDYEKRRALSAAIDAVSTPEARTALFRTASSMSSSYELAELLIAAEARSFVDTVSAGAYFTAVDRVTSDYERHRTLSALLKQHPTSPDILAGVLRASTSITSDFELASLLVEFAGTTPVRGELRELYLKATRAITSDFEYRRALQALLEQDRRT